MAQPKVKLPRVIEEWEPILVDLHQLLDALVELIGVEERHIDVVCRVEELIKVCISSK
jgi:hypothetical protein